MSRSDATHSDPTHSDPTHSADSAMTHTPDLAPTHTTDTHAVDTHTGTEAGSEPTTDTHGWRRLSVRMLAVHPVQELVRTFPALIGLLIAGSSSGHGSLWSLIGLAAVIVLGTLRWFTTTYRITPDQVQVRRGLLRRRVLTVPRDRVRTVDVTANAMHRLVGLARVVIGTGRSDRKGEDGLKLDALAAPDAHRLREELLHRAVHVDIAPVATAHATATGTDSATGTTAAGPLPSPAHGDPRPSGASPETRLATLRPSWIRYGPFTLSGLITIGVLVGFGGRALSEARIDPQEFGPVHLLLTHLQRVGWVVAGLEVLAVLVVLTAVASTLAYVLAFWNFRLSRHVGGSLHVNRGLITTRATSIEERRMRGVELSEPLLLRAAGGARCIAIATGLRVGRGAERGGSLLLPPAPRGVAVKVAGDVFGRTEPFTRALTPHGSVARRRRYTRALGGTAVFVAVLAVLHFLVGLPSWAWETSLLLLPCAALVAGDRSRSLGHALADGALVCRLGSLIRRRSVLACDGVIGWNMHRSYFQRRAGLMTLTATTAAGRQHYDIQDVEMATGLRLADQAVPGLLTPFLVGADATENATAG